METRKIERAAIAAARVRRARNRWYRLVSVLMCISIFFTTYALIMPALTLEADDAYICGLEAHAHTGDCYERIWHPEGRELICGLSEEQAENGGDPYVTDADTKPLGHTHTEECYQVTAGWWEEKLICELPEHEHDMDCLTPATEISPYICGWNYEHTHTDACYEGGVLICTLGEHLHTDDCLPAYERLKKQTETEIADVLSRCLENRAKSLYTGLKQELLALYTAVYDALETGEVTDAQSDELIALLDEAYLQVMDTQNRSKRLKPMLLGGSSGGNAAGGTLADFAALAEEANGWQIVEGSAVTDGVLFTKLVQSGSDTYFRLMKHIIPLGGENEFEVRLSVEPTYYHEWDEIMLQSGMLVSNNKKEAAANQFTYEFDSSYRCDLAMQDLVLMGLPANGHYSMMRPWDAAPLQSNIDTNQAGNDFYINRVVMMLSDGGTQDFYFDEGEGLVFSLSANSGFSIYYNPTYSPVTVKLRELTKEGAGTRENPGTIIVPADAFKLMVTYSANDFEHLYSMVTSGVVTDELGDWFELLDEEPALSGYDSSVSVSGNTITWTLGEIVSPPAYAAAYERIGNGELEDGMFLKNAYEMAYRVRLKTENEGFVSCGDVNGTSASGSGYTVGDAELRYTVVDDETVKTADFEDPTVKGLLYDVSFTKVNENGEPLKGAAFRLTREADGSGVTYEETLTSGSDGTVCFSVPCGDYLLTETDAPEGYRKGNAAYVIPLSFTEDPGDLTLSGTHYRYSANDETGEWQIVNTAQPEDVSYTLLLVKADKSERSKLLSGAEFRLTGGELESPVTLVTGPDGAAALPNEITLKTGMAYTLSERTAPPGYIRLPADFTFMVTETDGGWEVTPGGLSENDFEAYFDEADETLTVTLFDSPGAELPSTGGSGIFPFVSIGLGLTAGSLTIGTALRRRRERRPN